MAGIQDKDRCKLHPEESCLAPDACDPNSAWLAYLARKGELMFARDRSPTEALESHLPSFETQWQLDR